MHETLEYIRTFARFPLALRRFLSHTITPEVAKRVIRRRLEEREPGFLRILEQCVYAAPRSPYLAMLRLAGCELGDVRALVARKGVEGTLTELRQAGVYVTFEEFKGRKPIVRGGRTIDAAPADFDSPVAQRDFTMSTGGSTGLSQAVHQDLDYIASVAPVHLAMVDAWGVVDAPTVHWTHILPGAGLRFILQRAHFDRHPIFWGSAHGWFDSKSWLKYDLATLYMVGWLRAFGVRVPVPRVVRLDEALTVARQIRAALDTSGKCLLYSNVSCALRVAVAAEQAGFDLEGLTMRVGGEPLTPGKAERIRRTHARLMPSYGAIETSLVGLACARPAEIDEVHLTRDIFAVVTHPHALDDEQTVDAINLTSLVATSSKVMLNYQIDDYGTIHERACGCPLHALGYTRLLYGIRSYSKLLGEGVTLIGSDLVRIIDEVLPERFGGSPLDYQFAEAEDSEGLTRLNVVVHPRLAIADESQIVGVILGELRRSSPRGDSGGSVWQRAGTLRVVREAPVSTGRGKLVTLRSRRTPAGVRHRVQ